MKLYENWTIGLGEDVVERHFFSGVLEFWPPICSAEHNHFYNFAGAYYEEQFCEIFSNLDQWLRRCPFKDISYLELWWPFVQESGTICAILVGGIKRNNSVKLF